MKTAKNTTEDQAPQSPPTERAWVRIVAILGLLALLMITWNIDREGPLPVEAQRAVAVAVFGWLAAKIWAGRDEK